MHEIIRARAERRLRDIQLRCMHGESHAGAMRFVAGRAHDRFLGREILIGAMNEPDLDVIGLPRELAAHQIACRIDRSDFNDRRVAKIEFRIRDH